MRAMHCALETLETRRLLSSGVQSLFPVRQYNVGVDPVAIATADLNGDGRTDIVVANQGSDSLTVLMSGANGVFTSSTYTLAGDPQAVAIGDMNGDGKADIVVATSTPYGGTAADNVTILLGNGNGTFGTPQNYALRNAPMSLALADFNGDGRLDAVTGDNGSVAVQLNTGTGALGSPTYFGLSGGEGDLVTTGNIDGHGRADVVVADEGSNTVYVLPDQSNGSLGANVPYTLSNTIGDIAVADVNGDGKADVITASDILLGNGSGLSAPTNDGLTGAYPLALGDFNGDGHPDVAAVSSQTGSESVQLNNGSGTFSAVSRLGIGSATSAIAVGDFNGDGNLDTVTANPENDTVSIQLGDGNGGLTLMSQQVFVGGTPNSLVSADFNGDGHLDLATANGEINGLGNTITVLTNDGTGTFSSFATYTVGDDPRTIVVGDFNGDGKPDLAVANYGDDTVSILLNLGDGQFAPAVNYAVGSGPIALATGDFNGDGRTDLVVADGNSPEVDLLLNKGSGQFLSAVPYTLDSNPDSITVGDFNGDGHPDIATASYAGEDVEVLTNNGHGGFGPVASYSIGSATGGIVAANLNGDAKSDLAFTVGAGAVDVMLANSTNFAAASTVYTGPSAALTAGDLNGDSKTDLVVSQADSSYAGAITVLLGNGNGTFGAPVEYSNTSGAQAAVIGDFNGDGKEDVAIATASYGSGAIGLFLGRGGGVLDAPMLYTASGIDPQSMATGDFNHDGHPDLVTANYQDSSISVFLNNGHGAFNAPQTYSVGLGPISVAVGDFNDDGLPDIVTANYLDNTISVLINNGTGGFNSPETFNVGNGPNSVVAADFNHDGYSDIAVTNAIDDTITVLTNTHNNNFSSANITLTASPSALAVGDFNDDGYADLVATSVVGKKIFVSLNNRNGSFAAASSYSSTNSLLGPVVVGDLNGDGHSDIVVSSYDAANYSDAVSVYLANSNGTLGTSSTTDVGDSTALLLADMNGDGKLDLITPGSLYGDDLSVKLGSGSGTFAAATTFDAGVQASALVAGDFDGDGKLDLAIGHAAYYGSSIAVALGNGSGGILASTSQGLSDSLLSIASGDFNNDGLPDLVTRNSYGDSSSYSVLLNDDGSFYYSQTFTIAGDPLACAVGDFNGDGNLDLAFIESNGSTDSLLVLLGYGDGTFQSPVTYSAGAGSTPDAIVAGDFNNDGKLDLAIADSTNGTVTVLLNTGTGFTVSSPITVGTDPVSMIADDFNNDGNLDLAVANEGSDNISILFGNSSGHFGSAHNISVPIAPTQIVSADFNNDGSEDLAAIGNSLGGGSDSDVEILLNTGTGSFATPVAYSLDSAATSIAVGDFNGDTIPDLAVSSYANDDVQILLNQGAGNFAAGQDYNVGIAPSEMIVDDFDGNSMDDIAVASYGSVGVLENQFIGIPTAVLSPITAPTTGDTSAQFTVTYSGNAILTTSFGNTNITVNNSAIGFSTFATLVSYTATAHGYQVTYQFTAPNGPFNGNENGTYVLGMIDNSVGNDGGVYVAAQTLGSFTLNLPIPDITPPTASQNGFNTPTKGAISVNFSVTFADNIAVNANSIGSQTISITLPDGSTVYPTILSTSGSGASITVNYSFSPADGSFSSNDNGTYTLNLPAGAFADTSGNTNAAATLATFTVNISPNNTITDTTPPTATQTGFTTPTKGAISLNFSVTFTDDTAVNANSITAQTISITLPDGSTAYPAILATSGSGASITVNYSFAPSDGSFTYLDSGTYTLNLPAGAFADTSGNTNAAATLGTFALIIYNDSTPPTATLSPVTSPSGDQKILQFTITYTDDANGSGINPATIANNNITVIGPDYSQAAALVSSTLTDGGYVAVYQIVPANAFFSQYSNGTYQINLNANAVADNAGNYAAAGSLGSFTVSVTPPTAPDITGTISAPTSPVIPASKKNSYVLTLSNVGNALLNAKVPVEIYASLTPTFDSSTAIDLGGVSEKLKLNGNGTSKSFKLSFAAPASISTGNYYLIAVVDPANTISEQYKSNNTFASSSTDLFEAPTIDLSLSMAPPTSKGVVKITVTNTTASNVVAKGAAALNLYTSSDDATIDQLLLSSGENLNLKPGQSKSFLLKPTLANAVGDYLGAVLTFNGSPGDSNLSNNTVFSGSQITADILVKHR
ncbi:MAG TPA: FG-GAP-like repeat-containing protein [Tepidisphaeraceae bacterium]|jgi:hypothetical protein